ncbi:hypothetical protein ACVWZW_005851 [Bradyrhizobium sp. F1.13.4]
MVQLRFSSIVDRALGASAPHRLQHVPAPRECRFRGNAVRWLLPCHIQRALPRMRIGAVLRPAVLLAFADRFGLCSTWMAQPRSVRIAGRLCFVINIEIPPAVTDPWAPARSWRLV